MQKYIIPIIILLNIVVKGIGISSSPGGISLEELSLIKPLMAAIPISLPPYLWRVLPLAASTLIVALVYRQFAKLSDNCLVGVLTAVGLIIWPWSFILSRFFNPVIFFLLAAVLIMNALPKYGYLLAAAAVLYYNLVFHDTGIRGILDNTHSFPSFLSLQTLFFRGDYVSSYLRMPKTGFFLPFDFIFLIVGLIAFFRSPTKIKSVILKYGLVGIAWFISSASSLFTYKSAFLLLATGCVIGLGYSSLLTALNGINKKYSRMGICALLLLIATGFFYTQELFHRHFNMFNSGEWGYAEEKFIEYLKNYRQINTVYYSRDASTVSAYMDFYWPGNKVALHELSAPLKINACRRSAVVCVFREHELALVSLDKEKINARIAFANGLPALFLVTEKELHGL